MSHHTAIRFTARLCATLALTTVLVILPAFKCQAALTQRDWMIALVDALGLSFGLPDEPQDPDYINILIGLRSFRFEAEDTYSRDEDVATLMSFRNFGTFSGRGWLQGTAEPSLLHLSINLPRAGEYRLDARLRGAGHRIVASGLSVDVDAEEEFTDVEVGSVNLPSGTQVIQVTLPPNGSIDSITLSAPDLEPVAPRKGWQPDEALTWSDVHDTMVNLLGLASLFPQVGSPLVIEAEGLVQNEMEVVTTQYLGVPSGGKWLRAGLAPAKVRFPVALPESGYYDLKVRAMGNPLKITIGDQFTLSRDAGTYLDDHHIKPLYLLPKNNISFTIPPAGGFDQLILTRRRVDAAGASRLLGLRESASPAAADLDNLTRMLAAFGTER